MEQENDKELWRTAFTAGECNDEEKGGMLNSLEQRSLGE